MITLDNFDRVEHDFSEHYCRSTFILQRCFINLLKSINKLYLTIIYYSIILLLLTNIF